MRTRAVEFAKHRQGEVFLHVAMIDNKNRLYLWIFIGLIKVLYFFLLSVINGAEAHFSNT